MTYPAPLSGDALSSVAGRSKSFAVPSGRPAAYHLPFAEQTHEIAPVYRGG